MIGNLITAIVTFFQPLIQYVLRFKHLESICFQSICDRDHFRKALEKVFKIIMLFDLHVVASVRVKHFSHAILIVEPVNFVKYFQ